jgi:kinesin family member 5
MSDEVVKVIVRVSPLTGDELNYIPSSCIEISKNTLIVYPPGAISLTFKFDSVYSSKSSQEEIYSTGVTSIVQNVMEGINGTVFTYGQASSGKTFTMFGDQNDPDQMGIIPRMITTIFDHIGSADESIEFLIKVSFCEVFMEKINDLLNPDGKDLRPITQKNEVRIENLREVYATCEFDIHELIKVGIFNKLTRDNQRSGVSSHTIFTITVQQTSETYSKIGKLCLVDLAEVKKFPVESGNTNKKSNNSLSNLCIVISALAEKSSHIPYRSSVLTRVLQESLGGNSKLIFITTCSQSPLNVEETITNLRFATCVKSIKNFPVVNRINTMFELKQTFIKKQENLQKLNKRLSWLETQTLSITNSTEILKNNSGEEDSFKSDIDYAEVKLELDEINNRILEQKEIKKNLEIAIESMKFNIDELKINEKDNKVLLDDLERKSDALSLELNEVEHNLEGVLASLDTLNTEYESETYNVSKIENDLSKTIADIEHYKCQLKCLSDMRSSLSKAAVEEQLRRRIKEEKDKNKIAKVEIRKLEYDIDLLLYKKYKDYIEADSLQSTSKKIYDLELNIDKARMKYLQDEKNLTFDQRESKIKTDGLIITAEKISKNYRDLTAHHAQIQLEKLITEKKYVRLQDKVLELTNEIAKAQKKILALEKLQKDSSRTSEIEKIMNRSVRMNSSLAIRRKKYSIYGEI